MSLKITILYLQQSECVYVCVSMRAVYLVLLNLSFLRMSVCVYVTERETVLMNSPL